MIANYIILKNETIFNYTINCDAEDLPDILQFARNELSELTFN